MATVLDTELKTFEDHRKQLLGTAKGKFVLIRKDQVVGVYDSKMDAINEGYKHFGNVPFLVKHIVEVETPENYVSNLLAI